MEKEHRGPKINANVVNSLLRQKWRELVDRTKLGDPDDDVPALIAFAKTIVEGLTDGQLLAIAKGDGELVGNTHDGVTYREKAELPACPRCGCKLVLTHTTLACSSSACGYSWRVQP